MRAVRPGETLAGKGAGHAQARPCPRQKIAVTRDGPPLDLRALQQPDAYRHPVTQVRLLETHISWVLLTGAYAYKIKKPVSLGFLDYSTLARRRQACLDELRLNRRFAPELYLEVVPITGTPERPVIGGDGEAIEYAVRMREFPQDAQLDRRLAAGRLGPADLDALAETIAAFHGAAAPAAPDTPHGRPEAVRAPVHDTLAFLHGGATGTARAAITALSAWTTATEAALAPLMTWRRAAGRVREVHGDLHLANLVQLPSGIAAFDCIEFSESLRWLDVINDLAFTTMDLAFRGRRDLAFRLLNRYLEITGDYEGVRLLPYYEVYRALVRAKVAAIRAAELDGEARVAALRQRDDHLRFAAERTRTGAPLLILMHGVTGSGKSWLSERLVPLLPAVRVRSDVERRRLHGIPPGQGSDSALDAGIYAPAASALTYTRLVEVARAILRAGEAVLVDAAFLRRSDRQAFRRLARELGARYAIVACSAPVLELERRIAARGSGDASEGSTAVLARQLAKGEALDADEQRHALAAGDPAALTAQLRALPKSS